MGNKVLVVEDNDALRQFYVQQLADEGFQVIEAADGHAALREFETKRPDVVVLETYMPGGDGIDVLGRLVSARHSASIVVNSADTSFDASRLTGDADAFVAKSGDISELVRTVHRFADAAPHTV